MSTIDLYAQVDLRDLIWQKSSYSGAQGNCVEVAHALVGVDGGTEMFALRDSKKPDAGTLRFTGAEWRAFLRAARAGEFNYQAP